MVRLRRVSTDELTWTRRRAGRGFRFLDAAGDRIGSEDEERVRALAIPPAWVDVMICPRANGHLQAVGTDEAGRRQYLYHPQWRAERDAEKFVRALALGKVLPQVRAHVAEDLGATQMSQSRAAALAVQLLDLGSFRIGSDIYADENGSFGLTTLRRNHVRRHGDAVVFSFTGKSGIEHEVLIDDPLSVAALADLRRRRGSFEELLAFKEGRRWQRLTADRVNEYIREASGIEATAKDFRTWHATALAAVALAEGRLAGDNADQTRAERNRRRRAALQEVADYLGNTPAIARSSYVHPLVLDLYDEGHTIVDHLSRRSGDPGQEEFERAVLRMLARAESRLRR